MDILGRTITAEFLLDWAIMAASLFNTIVLLWLGLTVLLNAERRGRWGVWVAGGGLLLASAFFVSHSAILGQGIRHMSWGMNFWWQSGWVPVVALPFAWYVVMLWYAGFWEDRRTALYRRHRPMFAVAALLAVMVVGLLIFADPLPDYTQLPNLNFARQPLVGSTWLLVILFPLYTLLCMGLSLDVVRRPGPTGRVMGDLARRRARPWLVATSLVLLMVSLLVVGAMVWLVWSARQRTMSNVYGDIEMSFGLFDLLISTLIAASNVLLGQAIVSYEIFTGKSLPRRGLVRQWRSAVVLAGGFSVLVAASLARGWPPVYGLLGATVLMTVFYALFNWRSYVERERYIDHLRPFVTSQRLYDELLDMSEPASPLLDAVTPFHALCGDVLGTRRAYLAAVGPLSPLAGPPLVYPPRQEVPQLPLDEIAAGLTSPQTMCVPVEPGRCGGAVWAVPLWSERGLVGVLLLGEKVEGGLYTQEEIEIARASSERLIDTRASAEMAQRLMSLQRQRLAESQVLDRRARRLLHDEVLPRLHAAMLALSGRGSEPKEVLAMLGEVHHQLSDLLREMPTTAAPEVARLGLVGALRLAVDRELGGAFDGIEWEIEPEAERELQKIPSLTAEVLYYAAREAIRNAGRYGRNGEATRPLHLRVKMGWREERGLEVWVEDDGVGLGAAGHSSGGSGQGLALHGTMMAVVGGSLSTESAPGKYTRVLLTLPEAQ
jgi:signal transduction histidine kinase